ncbi:MAG: glycosyltransferase family 2 protein [Armatimonadota bacterium]
MQDHPVVSIIIPAYNEADTIVQAIERVRAVPLQKEILVVDDGSTDATPRLLAEQPDVVVLRHERNLGKGMAIRTAIVHATGDIIIIQDADLEYDPMDIPRVIAPIAQGKADVVYGSRFLSIRRPKGMRLPNYLINRLLAAMVRWLYWHPLSDEATCYKAFRADLLKNVPLTCQRFEFCPEVTAKVIRRGVRIMEVPIHYEARTNLQGKKIRWWDGVEAIWTLIKWRFKRF